MLGTAIIKSKLGPEGQREKRMKLINYQNRNIKTSLQFEAMFLFFFFSAKIKAAKKKTALHL